MELGLLELASIVAGAGSSSGVLGGTELVADAVKGEMKFREVVAGRYFVCRFN
jgi:hypothetical protein